MCCSCINYTARCPRPLMHVVFSMEDHRGPRAWNPRIGRFRNYIQRNTGHCRSPKCCPPFGRVRYSEGEERIETEKNSRTDPVSPRTPLIPSDHHFQFKRLQFPVGACFAVTIDKAQGQCLIVAGVDLRNDRFSHGQSYVACSRVSSPDGLGILQPEGRAKNIVYEEQL